MLEKRTYARFAAKFLMSISLSDEGDCGEVEGIYSENVSGGGLRIVSPEKFADGNALDISFVFPSDPIPLCVKGKVIWSREGNASEDTQNIYNTRHRRAGIQFVDIDAFSRERILRRIKAS